MNNTQNGSSSAADARVGSLGSHVHFGRGYVGSPQWGFQSEKDALVAVP